MSSMRRLLVVLALVAAIAFGTAVSVRADGGYHMVRSGETLSSLGRIYGLSWYDICQANNLRNPNLIYIGQVLYIPQETAWAQSSPGALPTTQPFVLPLGPSAYGTNGA